MGVDKERIMKCNGCTVCCKIFKVPDLDKKPYEDCIHRGEKGCKIYSKRPNHCRKLICAYAQMKKCSEDLRPDNCGIVFERYELDDSMFIGTQDPDREISEAGQKQIRQFQKQGFNVLIKDKNGDTKLYNRFDNNSRC